MAFRDPIRDVLPYARELKFLAPAAEADRILRWMRNHLGPDPHGQGPERDAYDITTLYFDTAALDVFYRRASFGRAKLRIRRYGDGPTAFLERKLRTDGRMAKRRTEVTLDDLARLRRPLDAAWIGAWFYKRLATRALGPVTQMSYSRIARASAGPGGFLRVTMDRSLRAQPAWACVFAADHGRGILDRQVVVEVKYAGDPPLLVEEARRQFGLATQAVSKYRLGATALGLDAVRPALSAARASVAGDPA